MLAIINATLILKDHLMPEAYLLVKDEKIADFGPMKKAPDLTAMEVLDAKGQYVGPGLVDIHTHAGGEYWFYEEPEKAAKFLQKNGTTSVLATLYFSMTKEELIANFARIKKAMETEANIAGFYTEAPYMNPKFGADREHNPWKGPIRQEDYMDILKAAGDDAKVWVVAPEREHIEEFVQDALKVNPAVRFAVGHSEATPQQVEALMPYGLCIGTHHTNATGTLPKYPECRGVCVDEAVAYNDEIYAEIISDRMGIHVDPYMQRLVRKIKGDDRVVLISDACVYDGPVPSGNYEGATDINFDFAGEIAGSKLTLIEACRNYRKHTGASLPAVFKAAAKNPAEAAGFRDRGEIRKGLLGDLIVVDADLEVQAVIQRGKIV